MSSPLDNNQTQQQQQQQPQEPDGKPRDPSGRLWQHSNTNIHVNISFQSVTKVEADQRTAKTQPESSFEFNNDHEGGGGGGDADVGNVDQDHDAAAAVFSLLPGYNSYWSYLSSYIWVTESESSVISELSGNSGEVEVPKEQIGLDRDEDDDDEEEEDYDEDVVLHQDENEVLLQNRGSFDVVLKASNLSDAEVPSSDVVGDQEVTRTGNNNNNNNNNRRQRMINPDNNMFLLRFQRKKGKITLVEDDDSNHHHFLQQHQQAGRPLLMTSGQLRGLIQFAICLATRYHRISIRCWVVGIMLLLIGTSYILYGIFPFSHSHFHDDKIFGLNIALGSGIPLALTGALFIVLGRAHQPSGGCLFAEEFINTKKLFLRYHSETLPTRSRRRPSAAAAEKVPGIKIHYQSQQNLQRFRDDETVRLVASGRGGDQHQNGSNASDHDHILFGLEVHVVSSSLNLV